MYKVYLVSAQLDGSIYYKIGWTKRSPEKRLNELKTANSHNLEIVSTFETKWGPRVESSLHKQFKHLKCNGEWFRLRPEDVDNFLEYCQKSHELLEYMSTENSWFQSSKEFSKYI